MLINMVKTKLINIDSDSIASSPTISSPVDSAGSYKVGPPEAGIIPPDMYEYALRFSLPHEAVKWDDGLRFEIMRLFNAKFKVHKYIWSFELKDDNETSFNPHLHAYLIAPFIADSSKGDWIKKHAHLIRPDALGRTMTNDQKELKKRKNYKAYIIKDGNYKTNYTIEEMDEIIKLKEEIQDSQKMRTEHKLLKIIQDKQDKLIKDWEESTKEDKPGHPPLIGDLNDIYHLITKIYSLEWKKAPPLNQCRNYAVYVGLNMGIDQAMRPQTIFY